MHLVATWRQCTTLWVSNSSCIKRTNKMVRVNHQKTGLVDWYVLKVGTCRVLVCHDLCPLRLICQQTAWSEDVGTQLSLIYITVSYVFKCVPVLLYNLICLWDCTVCCPALSCATAVGVDTTGWFYPCS